MKNDAFYRETPWWVKITTLCYVQGDYFFVLPAFLLVVLATTYSFQLGMTLYGLFLFLRQSGEMVFWLLQQFGGRTYRPFDFGMKHLDNNAIYILYQTFAFCTALCGAAIFVGSIRSF